VPSPATGLRDPLSSWRVEDRAADEGVRAYVILWRFSGYLNC
jgi:hypothetical protein